MALKDIEKKLYGMDEEEIEEEEEYPELEIEEEKREWRESAPIGRVEMGEEEEEKKAPTDFYKKRKKPIFLFALLGVLAIVLIVQGFFIAQRFFSREADINISISVPDEILIANPFDLSFEYENDSQNLLQDVVLVVEIPNGVRSLSDEPEGNFIRKSLGNVGTGSKGSQEFELTAVGEPNTILKFTGYIQYSLPGFSSRFEKKISENISLSGSSVGFNLVFPESVVSENEFMMRVDYFNNTDRPISNLKINLFYPLGFEYSGANIEPESDNNIWLIEELPAKESGSLEIYGKVVGQAGSFFEFLADFSIFSGNTQIDLGQKTAGLSIFDSPLRLNASLSSKPSNYIANLDDDLTYKIEYFNNTEVGLEEAIIKVSLDGEMFDLSSVQTDGYFDSGTKRIIFNAGNTEALRLINRGEGDSVEFRVRTRRDYPIRRMNDKNYLLKIRADLESPTVPSGVDLDKTTASAEFETKVVGKVDLLAKSVFRDAPSGIVNKGGLPLTVGSATNFTIHIKLINYSTDLSNVRVRTTLSQGVTWTGQVAGDYGDDLPQYNDRTGEVVWTIPILPATVGVVLPAKELIFQISATPSLNQVGQYMDFIEKIDFSADDDFTGKAISFSEDGVDSSLKQDPSVSQGEGIVQP